MNFSKSSLARETGRTRRGRVLSGNLPPSTFKLLAPLYHECVCECMSVYAPQETGKEHFQDAATFTNTLGQQTIRMNFFIKCPSIKPFPRKWNTAWNQRTAFSTNNELCGEQVLYLNDFPPALCQVWLSRRPTLLGWGLLPLWPSGSNRE